jgi:hypothetical protein
MNRREFMSVAGASVAPLVTNHTASPETRREQPGDPESVRDYWVGVTRRLADPVLENLAKGTLKSSMPVEQAPKTDRRAVSHLEALGRLIAGIAPWLELPADNTAEGRLRAKYADLARQAIARAVDPASPDFLNFTRERQPLVDAAFLAEGIIRAPRALGQSLGANVTRQLVAALESTRTISPGFNNWLLFSATVEAALNRLGAPWDRMRVDYALRQHEQWYKGDGTYGDGPVFHWDYYNSFVIQPMLLDVLDVCANEMPAWKDMLTRVEPRARRYAAILERLIAPDGSFPAIGRSIAYRFGAFHLLAQMALRRALPDEVMPAQVRGGLTAVIRRSIQAPGTFDANGWLQIGFCGHQPGIGETYISTGSLYLCSFGLLPLGLPPADPFWSSPAAPWTSVKAWGGEAFPIDRAISG